MADLLEITPSCGTVKTARLGVVDVPGITLEGITFLIKKHPEVIDLLQGGGLMPTDMTALIDLGDSVLTSFLAAGLGHPGDEKAEEMCRKLNPEDAWDIGRAIIEESFQGGAQSFFDKVVGTVNQFASIQKTAGSAPAEVSKKRTSSKVSPKVANG